MAGRVWAIRSYEHLGESDWTLVVQGLNNWVPKADELIQYFYFIPRWRLEDVMVSYATPGGGVGPHIDLYDVFICQGSGRRRWQGGDRGQHKEFAVHPALLRTEAFEPIIDVELLPGDILLSATGFSSRWGDTGSVHELLSAAMFEPWLKDAAFIDMLTTWVNAGFWYFQEN